MVSLQINGRKETFDAPGDMPLLWVLRDVLGLTGTKFGCAACHDWTGAGALTPFAALTGAAAVNDPSAVNVVQIVLNGMRRSALGTTAFMPAFGDAYSDSEIAAVANYVTARFGSVPSRVTSNQVADLRRQNGN